ncbi:hypothetical protein ACOKW7_16605 [Limnospira platensis CENA597]
MVKIALNAVVCCILTVEMPICAEDLPAKPDGSVFGSVQRKNHSLVLSG